MKRGCPNAYTLVNPGQEVRDAFIAPPGLSWVCGCRRCRWLLTRDGQTDLSVNVDFNSRRTDVAVVAPESTVPPGTPADSLLRMNHYSMYPAIEEARQLAEEYVTLRG